MIFVDFENILCYDCVMINEKPFFSLPDGFRKESVVNGQI